MFDVFKKLNERGSVTDELLIDIYASPELRGLAILIDRPFRKTLQKLELDLNDGHLIFVFEGEKKDLGTPLKEDLVPFFLERDRVKFNVMDMETLTPVESFIVPLSVREKRS
ncbi:MAG: hypothetical protein KDI90_10765 [Alphaproteobacteria bacterium]|nr:hypothetical protein [Alphaproteobacteria bacterium]MCB9975523.1 hypothetical protein [Rhodospirillales bacterium]